MFGTQPPEVITEASRPATAARVLGKMRALLGSPAASFPVAGRKSTEVPSEAAMCPLGCGQGTWSPLASTSRRRERMRQPSAVRT